MPRGLLKNRLRAMRGQKTQCAADVSLCQTLNDCQRAGSRLTRLKEWCRPLKTTPFNDCPERGHSPSQYQVSLKVPVFTDKIKVQTQGKVSVVQTCLKYEVDPRIFTRSPEPNLDHIP